ncbi:MAG: hypothetical protein HYX27_00950 [Acidobacteria bacterium]|nr:hypothetical protein [Acidobacteriota bacterium]
MALDLRIVIGRLLLAIGLQLVVYGFLHDGRAASMDIAWGSGITLVGAIFHLLPRLVKTA